MNGSMVIMMIKRKHEAMYAAYGKSPKHLCRDCLNFIMVQAGARRVSKCKAYGITASSASDWSGRECACGLYGIAFEDIGRPCLRDTLHRVSLQDQCDGQMEIT